MSSRCGCLKWLDAPRCTLELSSAHGELRGGGSGEQWSFRCAVVVGEKGLGELGFRELPSLPHEQIDDGLIRKRHPALRLS